MRSSVRDLPLQQTSYSARTVDYYIQQIDPDVIAGLTPGQLAGIRAVVESAMPRPAPKIVDLRINVDLIFSRFYIVLFVGKERRKTPRRYSQSGFLAIANRIAAFLLLIGLNLTISLFVFLMAYLAKSALGINLFSQHLSDYLR